MRKAVWMSSIGAVVCAAVVGVTAQLSQSPPPFYLMGCVQGTPGNLSITDSRSKETYKLDMDSKYDWHWGHTLQVKGKITDMNAKPPKVKVDEVIYLSATCQK